MRKRRVIPILVLCYTIFSTIVYAEKKGEGAIALDETPIYLRPDSLDAATTLKKGQPVAAIRNVGLDLIGKSQYVFDEKNGRVQVYYFPGEDSSRGKFYSGWVDPDKLLKFYYGCDCGTKEGDCDPIETRGFRFSFMWNSCFKEAWDRKASEVASKPTDVQDPSEMKQSVEERLSKLDELLKSGLITKDEYDKKRAEILASL